MWRLDFAEFDVTENKLKLFSTFDLSVYGHKTFRPFFSLKLSQTDIFSDGVVVVVDVVVVVVVVVDDVGCDDQGSLE